MEGARTWSTIDVGPVRSSVLAFYQAHPECGMVAHIERGEFSLMCRCERCKHLRAYEVSKGQASSRSVTPLAWKEGEKDD
jgi:hypothetical protein